MAQWFSTRKVRFSNIPLLALFFILFFPFAALSQHSPKIPVSLWSHGPQQHAVDCRQGGQPFRKERSQH